MSRVPKSSRDLSTDAMMSAEPQCGSSSDTATHIFGMAKEADRPVPVRQYDPITLAGPRPVRSARCEHDIIRSHASRSSATR